MKRRAFVQLTFLSYLALKFPFSEDVFARSENQPLCYATRVNGQYFIHLFDSKTSVETKVSIPFHVHSVTDLGDKKALLIQKEGLGCCVVDFKIKKIIKVIDAGKDEIFYGHAQIDFPAKKIYFPQRSKGKNHIFVRSLDTFEKISKSIYETDKEIHMISMVEEDRLAICIDDRKASSIDILNLKNNSVRSISIQGNYFRPGHICTTSPGNMYVTGIVGNDAGAAILNYRFKDITYLDKDFLKKIQPVFWLKNHPTAKVVCGVSPDSNEVIFISQETNKILKQLTIIGPFGVDIFDDQFVVIGPQGMSYIDPKSFKINKKLSFPDMASILDDFHPVFFS